MRKSYLYTASVVFMFVLGGFTFLSCTVYADPKEGVLGEINQNTRMFIGEFTRPINEADEQMQKMKDEGKWDHINNLPAK